MSRRWKLNNGKSFCFGPLYVYYTRGLLWFRIFGMGMHFKRESLHPLLFSERNGFVKYYKIAGWIIKPLKNRHTT